MFIQFHAGNFLIDNQFPSVKNKKHTHLTATIQRKIISFCFYYPKHKQNLHEQWQDISLNEIYTHVHWFSHILHVKCQDVYKNTKDVHSNMAQCQ